ncbi:hypothetical protein BDN70DRAFT_888613 [Pholiota conissans]|uniref:Uncharacterized protein n=1 Tax=Pholiota conissans TaxID=109636 RepID=A0A9P5YNR5_9AGAR|nr:hypothetical protein BDN70DRAFT_888613 [Pholiota conissans]
MDLMSANKPQTRRRTLNAEELEADLLYAVLTYRGELASCRLFQGGARIGPPNGFSKLTWPKVMSTGIATDGDEPGDRAGNGCWR